MYVFEKYIYLYINADFSSTSWHYASVILVVVLSVHLFSPPCHYFYIYLYTYQVPVLQIILQLSALSYQNDCLALSILNFNCHCLLHFCISHALFTLFAAYLSAHIRCIYALRKHFVCTCIACPLDSSPSSSYKFAGNIAIGNYAYW